MKQEFSWYRFVPIVLFWALPAVAAAQPNVWITSSLQRTGPTDPAGSGTSAQIFAGKGEYQSFQIVVQAPSSGLSNVNLTVSSLTGPGGAVIPNTAFTLYREQYVYVSQGSPNWGGTNQPLGVGWYADGLIPFNNPSTGLPITGASIEAVPFNLTAANNQPFWVDVLVPRTATAGTYTGTYTVTSNQGSASGTITLTVWHFTIPETPTLHSSFLYWTADSLGAEEELLRNRIAPLSEPAANQSSLMSNYGLGGVGLPFWSGADVSNCTMTAAPTVAQFQASAATQQSGLYKYDYSADEITACSSLFPVVQQWAYNMHQAGIKNLVTMAPNPVLYDDGSGTNHSAVDIWTMLPEEYNADISQMPVVLAKGDSLWSYNSLVQDAYSPKWEIDFSPINLRIQPGFISQSLGLTGLLYWRVDDWLSSNPWTQVNNTGTFSSANYPGEGMFVYPGAEVGISGVAPSMRLKWLRDGVDDYEYVAMLKAAGQGTWALGLAASVGPDWTNWTRDINLIASVRQQLGQELDQLSAPASAPAAVSSPSPASASTGVSTTPTLSWAASSGATSYSVSFGTSPSPGVAGSTTGTTFAPGSLASGTTYYWSVAAVNATGSTPSATWSFTTAAAVPTAPASPSPATAASGISRTPTLSWGASSGATSYNVYFGTSPSPGLAGSTTGTTFGPGTLASGTTYYWSVAAVNAAGSAPSATWSFTTAAALPSLPAAPASPSPAAAATGVSTTPTLTWGASAGATSYGVYFGTSSAPSLVATIGGTSYSPGTLTAGASYYWKVAAINSAGSTASPMWSFATAAAVSANPTVTSVTPSSGSGSTTTFKIGVSDANGAGDLAGVEILVNSSLNGANACWIYYNLASASLSLASNSSTTWTTVNQGSSQKISNSQCSVTGTLFGASESGSAATLQVAVTFNQKSFAGTKNVYIDALSKEGLSSGYELEGKWTVP